MVVIKDVLGLIVGVLVLYWLLKSALGFVLPILAIALVVKLILALV